MLDAPHAPTKPELVDALPDRSSPKCVSAMELGASPLGGDTAPSEAITILVHVRGPSHSGPPHLLRSPSLAWFNICEYACALPQRMVGEGGHGRVAEVTLPGIGVVAAKELLRRDPHAARELEVVRV